MTIPSDPDPAREEIAILREAVQILHLELQRQRAEIDQIKRQREDFMDWLQRGPGRPE